jgi:hypothetical protein
MFVTDRNTTALSHVTFYRCSLCISEHVSSEPVVEPTYHDLLDFSDSPAMEQQRYLMI